ncbi:MAG TPA: hypothetical protein VKE95_14680 [Burkholderiales bacterium]|nr:hypothetical protein [Burkholderiales bacterium]
MGRIGRTYPRHDFGPAFVVPAAPGRLIFARRDTAARFPGVLAWLSGLVSLLLAGPSL